MNAMTQIFHWFRWRHQFAIPAMIASVLVAQASFWIFSEQWTMGLLQLSVAFVFFNAMTIFTFGNELDLTSGQPSFPRWLKSLPINSWTLAAIPALAMVIAMAWCWVPAAIAFMSMESDPAPWNHRIKVLLLPFLGISTFGCWLQAIAWWQFRTGWSRLVAIGTFIVLGVTLLVFNCDQPGDTFLWGSSLVAALSGLFAAILSGVICRNEGWTGVRAYRNSVPNSEAIRPRNEWVQTAPAFQSSWKALTNREWKHVGRFPVWFAIAVMSPFALGIVAFLIWNSPEKMPPGIGGVILTLIPLIGIAIGLVIIAGAGFPLAKDRYWKGSYKLPVYLTCLPVSNDELYSVKFWNTIRVSLAIWGAGLLILLTIGLVAWLNPESTRGMLISQLELSKGFFHDLELSKFPQRLGFNSAAEIAVSGLIAWWLVAISSPWVGVAMGLSGQEKLKRLGPWLAAVGILVSLIVVGRFEDRTLVLRTFLISSLVAKTLAIVGTVWWASIRRVNLRRAIILTSSVTGLGIFLSGILYVVIRDSRWPIDLVMMSAIVLIPCASILFARLAVDLNRHS